MDCIKPDIVFFLSGDFETITKRFKQIDSFENKKFQKSVRDNFELVERASTNKFFHINCLDTIKNNQSKMKNEIKRVLIKNGQSVIGTGVFST